MFLACAAFALLIFAARALGHILPPPEALHALHLTDCALPCWMGITPGQTSYEEALRRVEAAYPQAVIVQPTQIFVEYLLDSSFGSAVLGISDGQVDSIYLDLGDVEGIALGDAALLYGVPPCVVDEPPLILFYDSPQGYGALVARGEALERWRQPLDRIESRLDEHLTCPRP